MRKGELALHALALRSSNDRAQRRLLRCVFSNEHLLAVAAEVLERQTDLPDLDDAVLQAVTEGVEADGVILDKLIEFFKYIMDNPDKFFAIIQALMALFGM
jgi:hypothetical protein